MKNRSYRLKSRRKIVFTDYEDLSDSTMTSAPSPLSKKRNKRGRIRKTEEEISVLREELQKNSKWDKQTVSDLAKRTGLTRTQIYKWGWDNNKKRKEAEIHALNKQFCSTETLFLAPLDSDMSCIKDSYKLQYPGFLIF